MNLLLPLLLLASTASGSGIGIRPDCSEKKTSVEELKAIAARGEIRTMTDFLRALPSGSLQTFTFVRDTRSFQHHGTSAAWPRVLRASADARLALSFVCNPASQDYGRVEVLHYVPPPVAAWRSVSFDFRKKKLSALGIGEEEVFRSGAAKFHDGGPTCAKCHSLDGKSPDNLLPIVPQYKTWDGFFGSDDDVVHRGTQEETEYKAFLARAKKDPCFSTLPWPKGGDRAYALYPFHEGFTEEKLRSGRYSIEEETKQIKVRNYHLRPNLKFTDAYSHLTAQRLAWRFLKSAEYRKVAPLLMMEAANCGHEQVAKELEAALPGYKTPAPYYRHTFMDPRTEMSWTKQLFAIGERIGIRPREWTMHFNAPNETYYNTGAAGDNGRDISIGKMAQGVLLSHLAETYPELKPNFRMARSVSAFFAPQDFSCIDDSAGQIALDSVAQKNALCQRLGEIAEEGASSRYAKLEIAGPAVVAGYGFTEPSMNGEELLKRLSEKLVPEKEEVERGKALVQTSCKGCHGETNVLPGPYHFLTEEKVLEEKLRTSPAFLWTAIAYVESGRMPRGAKLTEEEKRAVQMYLLERAKGRTGLNR